ncbi:MAG: PAS domain S-box protein [Deltaproteobacteria bacterium]|nr:PAS domain S-box protein [Deltaproteobacteria bacterium]
MELSEKDRLVQQLKEATQQVRYWKQIAKKTGKLRLRESENLSYMIQTLKQTKTQLLDEIAERKSVEAALRKSEDDMKGILDATTESIVLIDRQGMVIMANQTVCERLGTKKEDFIGRCIYDFFPSEVAEKRRRKWEEVFNTGKLVSFEDSRESMTFEQRAYPVFSGGNRVERIAIFARNVTDRRQAEDALRESEERYRSFFKNNHSIMLLIDPENADIVDANPAAISYYGWSHEDITGKKITDIVYLMEKSVMLKYTAVLLLFIIKIFCFPLFTTPPIES